MDEITLQQIEIFLTVAEKLSLSAAAKELYLDQAAISRRIQRLEASFGTRLFNRTGRGVELTEEGKFLYSELKPFHERLTATLKNSRVKFSMPDSVLRVGCLNSSSITPKVLPVIEQYQQSHPDVYLNLEYMNFRDLRESLVCERVDCIICYSLGFGEYRRISTKKLCKFDSFFAVSSKHHMARLDTFDKNEAAEQTLYLLSLAEMKDAERRSLQECLAYGFLPRDVKYLPNRESLIQAIRTGEGITICDSAFGSAYDGDIRLYRIDKPVQDQYLILAWRSPGTRRIAREFISMFREIDK